MTPKRTWIVHESRRTVALVYAECVERCDQKTAERVWKDLENEAMQESMRRNLERCSLEAGRASSEQRHGEGRGRSSQTRSGELDLGRSPFAPEARASSSATFPRLINNYQAPERISRLKQWRRRYDLVQQRHAKESEIQRSTTN